MARQAPEQAFQRQVAHYLNIVLPKDCWWSAFPSGGGGRIRGAILKATGLRPGVPDLLLIRKGRAYWIELKAPKGSVSAAQRLCHEQLTRVGSEVFVARTLDDIADILEQVA